MDRKQLIKLLMAWQNEQYQKSGMDINSYPFVCFDFCTDFQLRQYADQADISLTGVH